MTFPSYEEITRACIRFHSRGGRITSGTWGDGKSCACPLTAVADLRGVLPSDGLSSNNVESVLHVDVMDVSEFVCEYDSCGETSDMAELGARIARFVDENELHVARAGLDSLDEDE